MKSFKHRIKKFWWLEAIVLLLAAHAFVACGKSGSGGVLASNPGMTGISNNCTAFGCLALQKGPQIGRIYGQLFHDDELDSRENANRSKLMELSLDVNTRNNVNMTSGAFLNLMTYRGNVLVSGQVQVTAPIIGCNIPQGSYAVQSQQIGGMPMGSMGAIGGLDAMLMLGSLTASLGVNVNNGQGFTINIQNIMLVPSNFVQNGVSSGGMNEARLVGFVTIPNCDNASFRVE
ncbi:MAG: hypothetical protein A4S09_07180 [Proteobacteria bacterium SG_bin7]|nr:MAG: hypothetical protein A4S09_07180 [Proteobacteria bacterium SG_bin7]